jgi:RNA polymerase sigma factor (sigma-70 family)
VVRQALAKLPRQQRAVLVLRYAADLPEAEIAELLGCSPGTVKTHAHRGLCALRDSLGDDFALQSVTQPRASRRASREGA